MVFLPTLQVVHPHRLHRKSAAAPNAESADGKETWVLLIRLLLHVPPISKDLIIYLSKALTTISEKKKNSRIRSSLINN